MLDQLIKKSISPIEFIRRWRELQPEEAIAYSEEPSIKTFKERFKLLKKSTFKLTLNF